MWSAALIFQTLLIPVLGYNQLPREQNYGVVFPRKLHSLYKRDTQSVYPDLVRYELPLDGTLTVIHIEKSVDLFADNYTESYYKQDGTLETKSPKYQDHCLYQGYIVHRNDSSVTLSTCRGLSGIIQFSKRSLFIEPLGKTDTEAHAVYEADTLLNGSCGVHNTSSPKTPSFRSLWTTEAEKRNIANVKKYLELYMVADKRVFFKYGGTVEPVKQRMFNIINYVNKVYKNINISVALIGIEVWNITDQIEVVSNIDTLLNRFTLWRTNNLLPRKPHDNAQFLTDIQFSGSAIGYAPMNMMCEAMSVGINQDSSRQATIVGHTLAHELGHNLGMSHDGSQCTCGHKICVMHDSLSSEVAYQFSDCSVRDLKNFMYNRYPACLLNLPLRSNILSPPVCGNKLTETGEECDCGEPKECTSKCCDPNTCKLKPGYQCNEGACCKDCQMQRAGTMCRPAKDECDLDDYCDGMSSECTKDSLRMNGSPCMGGKGACYNGTCPIMNDQCAYIWGGEAAVATDSCFNINTQGARMGYCKKQQDKYIPCEKKDVKCGLLFCTGGYQIPKFAGSVFQIGTCKTFAFEHGIVSTGSKCGDTDVCFDGKCSNIVESYKTAECAKKCPAPLVCDHELQCHCESGWPPPSCTLTAETPTSFFEDSSSGYHNVTSNFTLEVSYLWYWSFLLWWLAVDRY